MITDTHIHLYAEEYDSDRDQLIAQAINAGTGRFLMPNIDDTSVAGMFDLYNRYPGICYPMAGLHPCYVKDDYKIKLEKIKAVLDANLQKVVAIGETGLDFYWDLTFKNEQELVFREQVAWAISYNLPVVIHSRNSTDELIAILKDINSEKLKGVFHCFSGNAAQAEAIIDLGFYFGLGGVATFKNSGLDKIIPSLRLDRILLETDAPYLAPVPYRGKRNEPAYLKLIAEKIAELKNITPGELAAITNQNVELLFKNLK